jgi:signal transduction protein with GAF and PtsI domain
MEKNRDPHEIALAAVAETSTVASAFSHRRTLAEAYLKLSPRTVEELQQALRKLLEGTKCNCANYPPDCLLVCHWCQALKLLDHTGGLRNKEEA